MTEMQAWRFLVIGEEILQRGVSFLMLLVVIGSLAGTTVMSAILIPVFAQTLIFISYNTISFRTSAGKRLGAPEELF